MDNSTLQQAQDLIKNGQKATAQKLLIEFLKANPNNTEAILWLASIQKDYAKQRQLIERVLNIDSTNETALRRLEQLKAMQNNVGTPPTFDEPDLHSASIGQQQSNPVYQVPPQVVIPIQQMPQNYPVYPQVVYQSPQVIVTPQEEKSPALGAILNCLIWGAGYVYTGNIGRAIATFLAGVFICVPLILVTAGIALLIILPLTFFDGWQAVTHYNNKLRQRAGIGGTTWAGGMVNNLPDKSNLRMTDNVPDNKSKSNGWIVPVLIFGVLVIAVLVFVGIILVGMLATSNAM